MCRCSRSGLLVSRLDQFDSDRMSGSIRPLHISYQAQSNMEDIGDTDRQRQTVLDHSDDEHGKFSAM
eukprot:4938041-Pyramimonas_sp.AAC.1